MSRALFALILFLTGSIQTADAQAVLSMRDRATVIDDVLRERLDTIVPMLMQREGVDCWVVPSREYNEDPVIRTMLPATWLAARRRTVLVFCDQGAARLAVSRYDVGDLFEGAWDPDTQPDQWARLAEILESYEPRTIAVNRSDMFAQADGITHSEYEAFVDALSATYRDRVVSGERLAVGWLETRSEREMMIYPHIVAIARAIIKEGLSEAVITPGVTKTSDVEWWYRDRIRERGLITWFHPSVDVQRNEGSTRGDDFSSRPGEQVIQPGDLLHVDFGITYLRLNTDTQQHAYVLRPMETDAPEGLKDALAVGNRLQDILTGEFATGRSGNQILLSALDKAKAEGIRPSIYTHPIGYYGHGAGPTIGLWDQQGGVPGRGDYPLYANTAHSIELNATVSIPEWGDQDVRIMLEEDAFFDGDRVWYIDPRQTELYLIPGG